MNKLKLKKLKFDSHTITFKDGLNYIIGANASGKTAIFNLIQFLLGLRKDLGFFASFVQDGMASLEVSIGNDTLTFQRSIYGKEIIITKSNQEHRFVFGSSTFYHFLNTIFQPQLYHETDQKLITSLLKECFITDDLHVFTPLQREFKLLAIGVNTIFPKRIKTYIKELESRIKLQELVVDSVDSYRNEIRTVLSREFHGKEESIDEILSGSFKRYEEEYAKLESVYKESKEFLVGLTDETDMQFQRKLALLEPVFAKYMKEMGIENRISVNDFFEGDIKLHSNGEVSITRLLLDIIIQSSPAAGNATGLLVNDGMGYLDHNRIFHFRKTLNIILNDFDLQYIEFTTNNLAIDKSEIVFDTTKNIRYA